jgi:hypothetical protein
MPQAIFSPRPKAFDIRSSFDYSNSRTVVLYKGTFSKGVAT